MKTIKPLDENFQRLAEAIKEIDNPTPATTIKELDRKLDSLILVLKNEGKIS